MWPVFPDDRIQVSVDCVKKLAEDNEWKETAKSLRSINDWKRVYYDKKLNEDICVQLVDKSPDGMRKYKFIKREYSEGQVNFYSNIFVLSSDGKIVFDDQETNVAVESLLLVDEKIKKWEHSIPEAFQDDRALLYNKKVRVYIEKIPESGDFRFLLKKGDKGQYSDRFWLRQYAFPYSA